MRQTAFSKIIQRIFGLALGTGIVLSAFPISIKGAAATDALTQRMEALPAPSAVTLQTKLQYEIESIRWAYDTLTPASLKGEISSSSLQRLEAAEAAMDHLLDGLSLPDVTEDTTLNWGQFLGNAALMGVSDAKAATSGSSLYKKWEFNLSKGASDWAATPGTPIVAGDYTYCTIGNQLRKFRNSDGLQVAKAEAPGEAMFFVNLAYGDGKIFVPRYIRDSSTKKLQSCVIAYDAGTLKPLYTTAAFPSGAQTESQTYYHNGYLYLASWGTGATFACYPTKDTNLQRTDEIVQPAWSYSVDKTDTFSANMGPAFVGDVCVFATGGSEKSGRPSTIVVANAKTGKVLQSFTLPGQEHVSSTLVYYEKNNRVYIAATNGDSGMVIRSYEVRDNGTLNLDTMRSFVSGVKNGGTQSTPVIYGDRLYIGGGGSTMGSEEPFWVIDANTMEAVYSVDGLLTKGSAALTTAYATAANHQRVYIYMIPYAPKRKTGEGAQNPSDYETSYLWILRDEQGQTEPVFEKVESIGQPEYCSQSVVIDKDGDLLFYNDAKGLYCYGNRQNSTITGSDVNSQIARLEAPDAYPYYNSLEIDRIAERYDGLSSSEKNKVTAANRAKLQSIQNTLKLSGAALRNYVEAGIRTLPAQVTLKDMGKVEALNYLARKAGVSSSVLQKANQTLSSLLDGDVIKELESAIDQIPAENQLSTAYSQTLAVILSQYNGLSKEQKAQVSNADKLLSAQELLESYQNKLEDFDSRLAVLYDLPLTDNRIVSDEQLDRAEEVLSGIEAALATLKTQLPAEDYQKAAASYTASRHEFLRDKIIRYLMENRLTTGDGVTPVSVTQENAAAVQKAAEKLLYHYAAISQQGRTEWNHEADASLAKKLLYQAAGITGVEPQLPTATTPFLGAETTGSDTAGTDGAAAAGEVSPGVSSQAPAPGTSSAAGGLRFSAGRFFIGLAVLLLLAGGGAGGWLWWKKRRSPVSGGRPDAADRQAEEVGLADNEDTRYKESQGNGDNADNSENVVNVENVENTEIPEKGQGDQT